MTGRERMMIALAGGTPDRLPITVHQWQDFQLKHHLHGWNQVQAYRNLGLDASVCGYDAYSLVPSPNWVETTRDLGFVRGERHVRHTVATPSGELTWVTAQNATTTFKVEHPVKTFADAERFLDHYPDIVCDRAKVVAWRDETGDDGIVRGFPPLFAQAGAWQDFCELVGTQEAIFWALDEPAEVHHILGRLTDYKVRNTHRALVGVPWDLIECGGGAGSSTVISPAMFKEFCLPYDKRLNDALREAGHRTVYHTCGGMMGLLDLIPQNGTDASETLSPPGVGGDIRPEDRANVKETLGKRVSLIGGIDQHHGLELGTPEAIRAEVVACFETFGKDGGYVCSASDHFFCAPESNLRALAEAARDCVY